MGDPVRCLPKVVHPDVAALKLQHNPRLSYGRSNSSAPLTQNLDGGIEVALRYGPVQDAWKVIGSAWWPDKPADYPTNSKA